MRRFSVPFFPILSLTLAAPTLAQAAADAVATPPAAMSTIHESNLLRHARFLASDQLGGRLTGSPGQEAAAKYIAGHFARLGLEPLGDEVDGGRRSWFQDYGITRTALAESTMLKVAEATWNDGFAVLGGSTEPVAITGKLKFYGFGRTRGGSAEVADGESLEGVIPVVLVKQPKGRVDQQLSVEQKFMMSFRSFGVMRRTTQNLKKLGAEAVVFALPDDDFGTADVLNYLGLSPGKDQLSPRFQGGDGQMAAMSQMMGGQFGAPAFVLSETRSRELLAALGTDLDAVRAFAAGDGELPASNGGIPGSARAQVVRDDEATACNVVAVLRGRDPDLADEAIVYSAHMDHVGKRLDGEVFNGADDNASGTSGLLEIARAFTKLKERPRRSIIFLSVSGEELGLWGSAYYADNPTWDSEKIIADINTDMIGRSGPESGATSVTVTPSHRHQMFSTLVQRSAALGEQLGLSFENGDKYYTRSDHFNFAKKGIPVVFFCNGEHEDYHQVTDHAEKLDGDKMERIARLAFWTGWVTANADERPETIGRQDDWR